jgi:hypothetical protein
MNKRIELEGMRFGRLLVERQAESVGMATAYICLCDCGTRKTVRGVSLRKGDTTSCGCFRSEKMAEKQHRHGYFGTREYNSWAAMIARCTDENHPGWKYYGPRGITVCERWRDFENFLADMGHRPAKTSIDRIDNDKGYEPLNCRWATPIQQRRNQRRYIERHGEQCDE